MKKLGIYICFVIAWSATHAQDTYFNQTRHTQFVNPSFYGLNTQSFVGVGYNSLSYTTNESIDTKIFYGVKSFDDLNFSISADFSNFLVSQYGLSQNILNLSYIYKLQIANGAYLLPSVSAGLGFNQLRRPDLIFGDQLDLLSATYSNVSNDPLSYGELSNNYLDLGAAIMLYNENFMVGVSLKHLNKPDISMNKEYNLKKPMSVSFQAAYERDINYFNRGFLPPDSFLYLYTSATSVGDVMRVYAGQELILGGFTLGVHEIFTSNKSSNAPSNATLLGINTGFNVEVYEFNFSYNFPLSRNQSVYPPNIFELSMVIKFDRFLRNNIGYFKRLKTDGFF
jgi:type IX secretion system PorP/SprF family membrane protein